MAVAFAGLAACTAKPQTASDVKITNGERTTQFPTAVALLGSDFLCSGTLVAPNLVITAAHCLLDKPDVDTLNVIVGNDIQSGARYPAAAYNFNPDHDENAPTIGAQSITDYGYVKLQDNVTELQPQDYVQILTDQAEERELLAPGATSILVGFGSTQVTTPGFDNVTASSQKDELGIKHDATAKIGPDQDGALFIGGDGVDTCQGDSGGPAYGQLSNGQMRVYGVTSRGDGCGGGGTYARMADGLCWILQDSGVVIPGLTIRCDATGTGTGTGTGAGTSTGLTGHALHMLIGAGDDNNGYMLYLAADGGTASAGLCIGDQATCLADPVADLTFSPAPHSAGGLSYFASDAALPVFDGLDVTMLAFDGNGKVVAATTVQLNRAN